MKNVVDDFEGYVTEVLDDTFWVRMWDQDGEAYEMELDIKKMLKSTEHFKEGIPCSLTFFDDESFDFRLIVEFWTQEEIDNAKQKAKEFLAKCTFLETADD